MLNKVSTKLSSLTTPFLNDVKSAAKTIGGAVSSNFGASNSDAKVAKAIVNKSPFETKDSYQCNNRRVSRNDFRTGSQAFSHKGLLR